VRRSALVVAGYALVSLVTLAVPPLAVMSDVGIGLAVASTLLLVFGRHDLALTAGDIEQSLLDAGLGDGIILGASRIEHLAQNMQACGHAPLHPSILDILDRGWEIIKPNCFKYFRP